MTVRRLLAPFAVALLTAAPAIAQPAAPAKDPSSKPGSVAAPKPAAQPPSSAEVGQAIDAMASSCSTALELHGEIAATADKLKAAQAARAKSSADMKKKVAAVNAAQAKVKAASKKPGADAAALVEAAKADYEGALADGKTYEAETEALRVLEGQLLKLVAQAEEASTACETYEATVKAAAAHAKKSLSDAKDHARKARQLASLPSEKALETKQAQYAKDLDKLKAEADKARAAYEAMKAEAAKQPPAPDKKAPPSTPAKVDPGSKKTP